MLKSGKSDDLDLDAFDEAFDEAWEALSDSELYQGEGLDTLLYVELIDIACSSGISDPETLRDMVLAKFGVRWKKAAALG